MDTAFYKLSSLLSYRRLIQSRNKRENAAKAKIKRDRKSYDKQKRDSEKKAAKDSEDKERKRLEEQQREEEDQKATAARKRDEEERRIKRSQANIRSERDRIEYEKFMREGNYQLQKNII